MKALVKNMNKKMRYSILTIMSVGFLVSCSSALIIAGVGGTGIVSGTITGFGSVFVNGIEFEIDEANTVFNVDGDSQTDQSDLSIGMLVTIKGIINADGVTGIAESLTYDDDVEGPIKVSPAFVTGSDEQQKELSIFDHTITVDALSTHYEGTSFETLDKDDVVEISGYSTGTNTLIATLVKKTGVLIAGSTEVELKGVVSNLGPISRSFNINNVVINYSLTTTDFDLDESQLSDEMFVEVEGILQGDGSIMATEIEQETNGFSEEDGYINLSGTISDYLNSSNFKINGQLIDASGALELSPVNALSLLANDVSIEVEGSIVDDTFIADEIEVKLKNIKISALVDSINSNGLSVYYNNLVGVINIVTNNSTQFEDESSEELNPFLLSNISQSDFVEIEATLIDNQIVATQVEREEPEYYILQGKLDLSVADTSVTVLGITYPVDGSTEYDGFSDAADFFSKINPDDIIRIKDDDTDGVADKISLGS